MKFIRCVCVLVSVGFLFGCSPSKKPAAKPAGKSVAVIDVGPSIEKPVVLNDVLLSVAISDVHGFLEGSGTVSSQFSAMLSGPILKTMLGAKLGDPLLEGFGPEKGLALVMLDEECTFIIAEVSEPQVGSYIQSLEGFGLVAEESGGLVLVGQGDEQLKQADRWAKKVQTDLLEAKRSPGIRIAFQPAALMAKNEETIADGLEEMFVQMQQNSSSNETEQLERFLEAELFVLKSLGQQVSSVEISIEPIAGSIHVSEVVEPVKGSRFSEFCNASVLNDFNPTLQTGVFSKGTFDFEYCLRNPAAGMTFLRGECDALAEEMDLEEVLDPFVEYLERWMAVLDGTVCESILNGSGTQIGVGYLVEISDEKATLDLLRTIEAQLDACGLFELYETLGFSLSIEFEENVRDHAGVKIHQLKMDISMETLPEEQQELMNAMLSDLTYEMALTDGALIYALGGDSIEQVIDRVTGTDVSITPLVARGVFPAGAFYYGDFDIGRYVSFISALTSNLSDMPGSMQMISQLFVDAEPITMASYCNTGRIKTDLKIPGGLLIRATQAGQLLMMQAMQKQTDPGEE